MRRPAARSFVVAGLVGVSVYFAVFGGEYSVLEARRVRTERVVLEQRLEELESVNDSLRSWAEALETDSATIERLARERYGMIRRGEVLYRIVPPVDSTTDPTSTRARAANK